MKLNIKGHTPNGLTLLLILPGLMGLTSLYGAIALWLLILWFPISLVLLYRSKKTKDDKEVE